MTRRSLFKSIAGAFAGSLLAKTSLAGPHVVPQDVLINDSMRLLLLSRESIHTATGVTVEKINDLILATLPALIDQRRRQACDDGARRIEQYLWGWGHRS